MKFWDILKTVFFYIVKKVGWSTIIKWIYDGLKPIVLKTPNKIDDWALEMLYELGLSSEPNIPDKAKEAIQKSVKK